MLAVWFMDDGSYTGRGYTLNTHCFNHDQQLSIIYLLKLAFQVDASIVPDRDKEKILIKGKAARRFRDIVEKDLHYTMRYKVYNPRNDFD